MKRILCSLLVATLPFGSVLADAARTRRRGDRKTEINPLGMSLPAGTKHTSK
jgi:hypothetical protein